MSQAYSYLGPVGTFTWTALTQVPEVEGALATRVFMHGALVVLVEGADPAVLGQLAVPRLATSSHQGEWLHQARLPWPCAWAMGHEGQGVGPEVQARAGLSVRIVQPGGEESLNVASAAAICLHASAAARAA